MKVGKIMAKNKSRYVCQNCGYSVSKWMGKCPSCESWNTLVEEIEESRASGVIKKRDVPNFT
jgi:DNA repair protein RadA/Sms